MHEIISKGLVCGKLVKREWKTFTAEETLCLYNPHREILWLNIIVLKNKSVPGQKKPSVYISILKLKKRRRKDMKFLLVVFLLL